MKFTIIKEELYKYVQYAIGFTGQKNVNTILQNILISAEEDKIVLKTTNVLSGFSCKLDAMIHETGITSVPCKKLLDIIRELPSSSIIDFNYDGTRVKIKSGKASFTLSTTNHEFFPTMSDIVPEYLLKIDSEKLKWVLDKTAFCISSDTSKIEYTGAHFKVYGNKLEVSSSDFSRIALAEVSFDEEFAEEFIINIPKKTINEVQKILDIPCIVEIETDKKQIIFKIGDIQVYSKILEKYIKSITALFKGAFNITAKINKTKLQEVLRKITAIASEHTHASVIKFTAENTTVYSLETEYGHGLDEIENLEYQGDEIEIIFNSKLLLETINNIQSETVTFHMLGRRNPCIITPETGNYKYLVTPLVLDKIQ